MVDFGRVLGHLKENPNNTASREGWNGKGIYIQLQTPDEHSKMSLPYIYIVTSMVKSDAVNPPRGLCPWLASQTDMLSEDWTLGMIVEQGENNE